MARAVTVLAAADLLLRSRRCEIVFADEELIRAALERMTRLADTRLSLTDRASFAVMDRLGLGAAFSFASDFRHSGYQMVP